MPIPRWAEIANAISAEIRKGVLAPGAPLPSETELAAQWHVSRMTAHRAMHELHQQGIVVRKRRAGTFVAPPQERRTGHVAVFLNTRDYLEQEYLAGIRAGLPDEYDLLFCDIRCDPRREAHYLERMAAATDGILCIPTCDPANNSLFDRCLRAGTHIVCVDCVPDGVEVDAIISDNYGASLQAVRLLIARGHTRIAHFTSSRMSLSSLRERYDAYQKGMAEAGIPGVRRWVLEFPFDLDQDCAPLVQEALSTLMRQPDRPTAVFCVHDYLLASVLRAGRTLGIAIPDDLEIVSFNDCPPIVPFLPGNVHRIVQRAYEIGNIAAERLCRRMCGGAIAREITRVAPLFHAAETRQTDVLSHIDR